MTPALRKLHRYTWFSLALLLPFGWLAAIRAIPDAVWQTPARAARPAALPFVAVAKESGDFVVVLRRDSTGRQGQVEILIKKPLSVPNVTIVAENAAPGSSPAGDTNLGVLAPNGICRFPLSGPPTLPLRLRFEDKIRNRLLRTVTIE